jgi:predicted nucleic acid-binding protein
LSTSLDTNVIVALLGGTPELSRAARRQKQPGDSGPRRILADFVIGAHAVHLASALLTLDRGLYRTAFPKLKILTVTF